ncbi:hypothetical protein ABZ894_01760 [Nocardia beijingensis]|uniref:hypothetical protein n=1 Tax=Nocardia beijingensis TaxID=95162 RepID=UPI0033C08A82
MKQIRFVMSVLFALPMSTRSRLFALLTALIAALGVATLPVGFASAANWSDILAEATDANKVTIPIRAGDADLGFDHYAQKHNLTKYYVIQHTIRTAKPKGSGARVEYLVEYKHAKSRGKVDDRVTLHIVAQAATRTDDGRYKTPDNKNIGVITAYCEGRNTCPDWLRDLSG